MPLDLLWPVARGEVGVARRLPVDGAEDAADGLAARLLALDEEEGLAQAEGAEEEREEHARHGAQLHPAAVDEDATEAEDSNTEDARHGSVVFSADRGDHGLPEVCTLVRVQDPGLLRNELLLYAACVELLALATHQAGLENVDRDTASTLLTTS